MNIQQINLGQYPNDGQGDDLRTAFEKIINNFTEIDSNVVLSAENLGSGIPLALETSVANSLQFRTIRSSNDNLAISFDSNEVVLTVSDIFLNEIIDVSSVNPTEKQVLSWTGNVWEPVNLDLSYLTDFAVVDPQVGNTLIWNGTQWVNETIDIPVQGVTRIIAGNNITVSPESGQGEVTINSTSSSTGIPEGFDFGNISNPTNILELLVQATPIDFGTITSPSSLYLDLGPIDVTRLPAYALNSNVSQVLEGGSFIITLLSSNVPNGTLIPYTITGVTSTDINNASLTGNFTVANGVSTLTIQTTVDGLTEGTETFTLTLNGITPSVSISVNILEEAVEAVDGGEPGTITFTSVTNGGVPSDTIFENTLDGGFVVFVTFVDPVVNGGAPSDTNVTTIIDGELPSTPITVLLDGGTVT